MTDLAIDAEGLSKLYRITQGQPTGYRTLRDNLASLWTRNDHGNKAKTQEFWALRDVSFAIRAGERIGIIGRNGAGKSTLLKILSKIVVPTSGKATVRGRLASLLEVGTGFHPELTGRENIYLNGTLLGMSRVEVDRAFDAIVDFAGIETHLDVPVKRYSSGMFTRLAFAVAAHLEPDILIVDEVLAVGDTAFQKKCIDRMHQMQNEGRTYLFVSHNMALISALCSTAMVLDAGRIHTSLTETSEAITAYNKNLFGLTQADLEHRTDRLGAGNVVFSDVRCGSTVDANDATTTTGASLFVRMTLRQKQTSTAAPRVHLTFTLLNELGHTIALVNSMNDGPLHKFENNRLVSVVELPDLRLAPGNYTLNVAAISEEGNREDWVQGAAFFRCELADYFRNGSQVFPNHLCFLPKPHWLWQEREQEGQTPPYHDKL